MPFFKTPLGDLHFLDDHIDPASVPAFPKDAIAISGQEAELIRRAQEAQLPQPIAIPPKQKFAAFLEANPDVLAMINNTSEN